MYLLRLRPILLGEFLGWLVQTVIGMLRNVPATASMPLFIFISSSAGTNEAQTVLYRRTGLQHHPLRIQNSNNDALSLRRMAPTIAGLIYGNSTVWDEGHLAVKTD